MYETSILPSHHACPRSITLLCAAMLLTGMVLGLATPAMAAGPDATLRNGADLCARAGDQAGFSPTDRLVTAVAVGLAESRCTPTARHQNGRSRNCPQGSTDRGLWQINDCSHSEYSAGCAYQPRCNATAAYQISSRGTNFRPWVTYRGGQYRIFLPEARAAVARLNRS